MVSKSKVPVRIFTGVVLFMYYLMISFFAMVGAETIINGTTLFSGKTFFGDAGNKPTEIGLWIMLGLFVTGLAVWPIVEIVRCVRKGAL